MDDRWRVVTVSVRRPVHVNRWSHCGVADEHFLRGIDSPRNSGVYECAGVLVLLTCYSNRFGVAADSD